MKQFNKLTYKQLLETEEFAFPRTYTVGYATKKLIEKLTNNNTNCQLYQTERRYYHMPGSYFMGEMVIEPFYTITTIVHFANKSFELDYNEDYIVIATVTTVNN